MNFICSYHFDSPISFFVCEDFKTNTDGGDYRMSVDECMYVVALILSMADYSSAQPTKVEQEHFPTILF